MQVSRAALRRLAFALLRFSHRPIPCDPPCEFGTRRSKEAIESNPAAPLFAFFMSFFIARVGHASSSESESVPAVPQVAKESLRATSRRKSDMQSLGIL